MREDPLRKFAGEAGKDQEAFRMPSYVMWAFSYKHRASIKIAGEHKTTSFQMPLVTVWPPCRLRPVSLNFTAIFQV